MLVEVSAHAVDRYIQRVDGRVSRQEARLAIMQIASLGRLRAVPRHWLRDHVPPSPGLRFITWSRRPDLCLLVRGGVVVTLITRTMCVPRRPGLAVVDGDSRRPAVDVARWRWNGLVDEDGVA